MTIRADMRKTQQEYIKDAQAQARGDFAHHQIRFRDERSWACFRPHEKGGWDSTFWFEAVVLHGGTLLIHGDIDLVHFARYGGYTHPEEVLRWMGSSNDLGYYVTQKAAIGMNLRRGQDDVITTRSTPVWLHAALCYIEDTCGVVLPPSGDINLRATGAPEWLCDLVEAVVYRGATEEDWPHEAYELGAFEWGHVPTWRLVYAHEALRKLVALLDEERVV